MRVRLASFSTQQFEIVLTRGLDGIHVDMDRLKKGEVKYVTRYVYLVRVFC